MFNEYFSSIASNLQYKIFNAGQGYLENMNEGKLLFTTNKNEVIQMIKFGKVQTAFHMILLVFNETNQEFTFTISQVIPIFKDLLCHKSIHTMWYDSFRKT